MASIFTRLFGKQTQDRETAADSGKSVREGAAAAVQESAVSRPASGDSNFVRIARETIHNRDTVSAALEAFAAVCRVPVNAGTEQLSFDTGTYALTGRPMFTLSLVRSYAEHVDDSEYTRLHIDLLYPPEEATAAFADALWSDSFASTEEFLDAVRADPACVLFAERKAEFVNIYTDLN